MTKPYTVALRAPGLPIPDRITLECRLAQALVAHCGGEDELVATYLASEAILDDWAGYCGPEDVPPRTPWDEALAAAQAACWPDGKPAGIQFEVTVLVAPASAPNLPAIGADATGGDDLPWPG